MYKRQEEDCIIVKGSVPGKRGNLLRIAPSKIVGKTIPHKLQEA